MKEKIKESGFIKFYRKRRPALLPLEIGFLIRLHIRTGFPVYIVFLYILVVLIKVLPYNKWLDEILLYLIPSYGRLSIKKRKRIIFISYIIILTVLKLRIIDMAVDFFFDISISGEISNFWEMM